MVTLNIIDTSLIIQLVVLCLAVGLGLLAVLSKRGGGLLWFVDCFAWAGVVIVWDNLVVQLISIVMAVISLLLFIIG